MPVYSHYTQESGCTITKIPQYKPGDATDGYAGVGESITYDITAINNGNVDITETAVLDAMFKKTDGG